MKIKLRPLEEKDAFVSYRWRNNPEIWKLTGFKPNKEITQEDEIAWIKEVLKRTNECRFAVCVDDTNQYIGNAQLTDISYFDAQYHLFIGEIDFWGKGIATNVAKLVIEYAIKELDINQIYSYFNPENISSIRACEKNGFIFNSEKDGKLLYKCYLR